MSPYLFRALLKGRSGKGPEAYLAYLATEEDADDALPRSPEGPGEAPSILLLVILSVNK